MQKYTLIRTSLVTDDFRIVVMKGGDYIHKLIRRIWPVVLLVIVLAVIVYALFQPKDLKVITETPLIVVDSCATEYSGVPTCLPDGYLLGNGKAESQDGNTLLLSKLTATGAIEKQQILLNDERMVSLSVSEQENGYYLILMKEKDAIESIDEYDGMAWYALVWIGKHTNALTVVDEFYAAGAPTILEPNNGLLLLSWKDRNGNYLSAYDVHSQQIISLHEAEAYVGVSRSLLDGVYAIGFLEGVEVGKPSTAYDSYLGLMDATGIVQDKYNCGQYNIDEICAFGDKIYALAHHRTRPGNRLLVADYDAENHKLKSVQTYSMPTIDSTKYTLYSVLESPQKDELQLMLYAPLSWDWDFGLIGTATIVFDDLTVPTLMVRTTSVTRYHTPLTSINASGETLYCFIDGDGALIYCK